MLKYKQDGSLYDAVALEQSEGTVDLSVRFPSGWGTVTRCRAGADGVYEQVVLTIRHDPPKPGEAPVGNVAREREAWGDKDKAEQHS